MLAFVAPWAPSMPIARSRRCASTVNPPTLTRAMSSIPSVAAASEIVTGLSGFGVAAEVPRTPRPAAARPARPARCVEQHGDRGGRRTWPGATRANSSSRFCGLVTMPTTRRAEPSDAPGVTEPQVQLGCDTAGQVGLTGAGRVVPAHQRQHRQAECAVRVLRAQAVGGDRAGHRERLVLDHVDPAEPAASAAICAADVRARRRTWPGRSRCRSRRPAGAACWWPPPRRRRWPRPRR